MERFPGPRPAGILHKPYDMGILKAELNRLLGSNDQDIYEDANPDLGLFLNLPI